MARVLFLSGGGFRATLFHLGVVRYLFECKTEEGRSKLHDLDTIVAVSGGSVLAAHMMANWERYTTDDSSFNDAAKEVLQFAQCDLRGNVFRRWFGSILLRRRAKLLEAEYDIFLDRKTFRDCLNAPTTYLACVNLTTAEPAWFSQNGFYPHHDSDGEECRTAAALPLSIGLAASSAFPPAFPPVELSGARLGDRHLETYRLCDGGVVDNTGLAIANSLQMPEWQDAIISNAGASIAKAKGKFKSLISRTLRVTDVMMEYGLRIRLSGVSDAVLISMGTKLPGDSEISQISQNQLANARTDLDKFSPSEVFGLSRLGYLAAQSKLGLVAEPSSWPAEFVNYRDNLETNTKTSWKRSVANVRTYFKIKDLVVPAAALLLCAAIFAWFLFGTGMPDKLMLEGRHVTSSHQNPIVYQACAATSRQWVFAAELKPDWSLSQAFVTHWGGLSRPEFQFRDTASYAFMLDRGNNQIVLLEREGELFTVPSGGYGDILYLIPPPEMAGDKPIEIEVTHD